MRISKIFFVLTVLGIALAFFACSDGESQKAGNSQVADNTPSKVVSLEVSGMTCGGCEINVNRTLKKIAGVKDVKSSYKEGSATVTINPEKVQEEQLIQALDDIGYSRKKKDESE